MHSFLSFLLSFHILLCAAFTPYSQPEDSHILFTETEPAEQDTSSAADSGAAEQALSSSITAPSAVLMEMSTGSVVFEKDSHAIRHPASITKIMTLNLIFEAIEKGQIHLEDTVTVSEHASNMGGSQVFLETGETQTVETLIKCISIASANDACVAFIYSRHYTSYGFRNL